jgi:hypothetical protein
VNEWARDDARLISQFAAPLQDGALKRHARWKQLE